MLLLRITHRKMGKRADLRELDLTMMRGWPLGPVKRKFRGCQLLLVDRNTGIINLRCADIWGQFGLLEASVPPHQYHIHRRLFLSIKSMPDERIYKGPLLAVEGVGFMS